MHWGLEGGKAVSYVYWSFVVKTLFVEKNQVKMRQASSEPLLRWGVCIQWAEHSCAFWKAPDEQAFQVSEPFPISQKIWDVCVLWCMYTSLNKFVFTHMTGKPVMFCQIRFLFLNVQFLFILNIFRSRCLGAYNVPGHIWGPWAFIWRVNWTLEPVICWDVLY